MIVQILLLVCYIGMGVSACGVVYYALEIYKAQKEITRLNKLQSRIKDLQISITSYDYGIMIKRKGLNQKGGLRFEYRK